MKTRILTGILFTLGVLLLTLPGGIWPEFPLLFIALVALMVARELWNLVRKNDENLSFFPFVLGVCLIFLPRLLLEALPLDAVPLQFTLLAPLGVSWLLELLLGGCWILFFVLSRGVEQLLLSLNTFLCLVYLVVPLSLAPLLLHVLPSGWLWLLLALFSPWFSDVFAYFTGYAFGKRKLIPRLSPKKTIAGFIGGVFGVFVLLGLTIGLHIFPHPFAWHSGGERLGVVVFGLTLGIFSQFGDWFASAIKRHAGIKDFGQCFPGHGGVLDRFDSVFFTLPVVFLYAWGVS